MSNKYLLDSLIGLESLAVNEPSGQALPLDPIPEAGAGVAVEPALSTPTQGEVVDPAQSEALSDELIDLPEDLVAVEAYVVNAFEQVENLINATADLNDTLDVAQAAQTDGGLNATGVAMLEVATESFYRRTGIVSGTHFMPAAEQFGGAGLQSQATRLAVESVVESVKKAFLKAGHAVKEIFARIMQFIDWVVSRLTDVEKRLDKAEAAIKTLKTSRTIQVKNPGLASRLATGAKVSDNLAGALGDVVDTQKSVFAATKFRAENTIPRLAASVYNTTGAANAPAEIGKLVADLTVINDLPGLRATEGGKMIGAKLPGNKYVFTKYTKQTQTGLRGYIQSLSTFSAGMDSSNEVTNGELTTLPVSKALQVIEIAREILSRVKELNALKPKLKEAHSVIEAGLKNAKGAQDGDDQDTLAVRRMGASFGMRAAGVMSQPMIALNTYCMALTRDLVLLVELTIKANAQATDTTAYMVPAKPRQMQTS